MKIIKLKYLNSNSIQLAEELTNLIIKIDGMTHLILNTIQKVKVHHGQKVEIIFEKDLQQEDIKDLQDEIDCTGFTWVRQF
jgi:hypothetical protein